MRLVATIISLLLAFFNSFSYGQLQDSKNDTLLLDEFYIEDIIVTANKIEEKAKKLPLSVSTITGLQKDAKNIETLTDLTSVSPGFHMPDYGTGLTSPIYIRGIGSRINEPAVALYVDDISYFDKATFNFDLYDIDRIEILRGPQGTLYGKNSLGGLIKVHTKPPKQYSQTEFSLGYGTYDNRRIYLKQHLPVIEDRLSISVAGNYNFEEGYYKNDFNDEHIGGKDNINGRLHTNYKIDETANLEFIFDISDNSYNGYPYAHIEGDNSSPSVNYNHDSDYRRKLITSGMVYEKRWDKLKIKSISSFQYFDDFQDIDQDFTPKDYFHVIQDRNNQYYTQEINVSHVNNSGLELMGGMFGYYQDKDKQVDLYYGEDAVSLFNLPAKMSKYKDYEFKTTGIAIFGQFTYNNLLIPDLNLTGGLRFAYESTRMDYVYDLDVSGNQTTQDELNEEMSEPVWLPKFSLSYNLSDKISHYITFTKGYKSGGFNSTIEREEDITFGPEHSTNYELGVKGNFFSNSLSTDLAVFYIDWQDQQVYQPVPSGQGSMLKNAGESHSKGMELEAKYRPLKNLVFFANSALTEAKYDKFIRDEDEGIDYSGNYIPYIPRMTFNIGSNLRIPLNKDILKETRIGLDYRGVGKHYWNDENTLEENYYGLVNFNVMAVLDKFKVTLWGKNIFNRTYDVFLFEFSPLQNIYAQQGHPARFGITISTNFK
ncbi:MAG: TonB-dependent receptor [Bacteroidales bacterium]